MPVRQAGAPEVQSAKVGGLLGGDGLRAANLLHFGGGGAITYDSKSFSVGSIDHEIKRNARSADGQARTWQQSWRDSIKKWMIGNRRTAAPKAGRLDSADNPTLLGRSGQNPRDLRRLRALNAQQALAPGQNANNAQANQNMPPPDERLQTARTQLQDLKNAIGGAMNPHVNSVRNKTTELKTKEKDKSLLSRLFGSKKEMDRLRTDIRTNTDTINKLGNDALNRLNNLEATLKGAAQDAQLSDQDAGRLRDSRRAVLSKMVEARLPGLRVDAGAQASVPQVVRDLVNGDNQQALNPLRTAIQSFEDAEDTPEARLAALRDVEKELNKIEDVDLSAAKDAIAGVFEQLALRETVEQLVTLEEENRGNHDYQRLRSALLNNMTRFGHTRDWASSGNARQQRMAAESLQALAEALRSRENVDTVIGADKRFDDLAKRLKITAATREIIRDNQVDNEARQTKITQAERLIQAEHNLRLAQRKLAAQLKATTYDGSHAADAALLGLDREDAQRAKVNQGRGQIEVTHGFFARRFQQKPEREMMAEGQHTGTYADGGLRGLWRRWSASGRLFTGNDMGGVRMDAQFLKAVRNTKDGDKHAQQVNLLAAEVGRLQDHVNDLKRQADPKAPLTQAEAALMRHAGSTLTLDTITHELNAATARKLALEAKRDDDDEPALSDDETTELQGLPAKIEELQGKRDAEALRVAAGEARVEAGPDVERGPKPRTSLGNFESQVVSERDRLDAARRELGVFADYGIDKETAKDVFADKGGLIHVNKEQNLLQQTEARLKSEADPNQGAPTYDQEQVKLVKDSVDALINRNMHSTDQVIKANANVNRLASKMFAAETNIMAQQFEISSDFSPEVQSNEFTRAVLQTYAEQNDALEPTNDAMRTRISQLADHLQNDKTTYVDNKAQLAEWRNEENQLNDRINNLRDDLVLLKKELQDQRDKKDKASDNNGNEVAQSDNDLDQKIDKARLDVERTEKAINDGVADLEELRENIRELTEDNKKLLAYVADQAAQSERNIIGALGGQDVDATVVTDFENAYAEKLARRQTLLDAPPAQAQGGNNADAPARMQHKDLTNVLRAAVLAARPKGTRLDAYNPVDRKQAIEDTLHAWGLDPQLVRPELDDIMSTSLDSTELKRWQEEFKPDDRSLGAGDKRYSGNLSGLVSRPFLGAVRADLVKKSQVEARRAQQMRHLNAQVDELVPGSKIVISTSSARSLDAAPRAKIVPWAEVGINASVEVGKEDEMEISCTRHDYELELKPGWTHGRGLSIEAEVGVKKLFAKLGAGVSVGKDWSDTHLKGVVLKFTHDGTPERQADAKLRMQTLMARMASGEELKVHEWNDLCDGTRMVFVDQNQGDLSGGIDGTAGVTTNVLDSGAAVWDSGLDVGVSVSASGTKTKRSKAQTFVDAETTTRFDERMYSYQVAIGGEAHASLGIGSSVQDPTSGKQPGNQRATDVADQTGLGAQELGNLQGLQFTSDSNLQVSVAKGNTTTWTRVAFARSTIDTDTATSLIKGAELDFVSSLSGHVLQNDEMRKKAAYTLLDGLGSWSGHKAEVQTALAANNAVKTELDKKLSQTSGSDFLTLKLALKQSAIDQANELIAQANDLVDPSRGSVTKKEQDEAAKLRKHAQSIVNDRKNYLPKSVNLTPTQADQITRKSPYIPLVSDIPGLSSTTRAAGLVSSPALEIDKTIKDGAIGGKALKIEGPISGTRIEKSSYAQAFANIQALNYVDPQPDPANSPFNAMGDAAIVPQQV
ncbi:MAG: hypothetical protein ACFB3T_12075 [Geminicoccaceae bacterium]